MKCARRVGGAALSQDLGLEEFSRNARNKEPRSNDDRSSPGRADVVAREREQTHCVWREGEADDRLRVMGGAHKRCFHGKLKSDCVKCSPCPHGKRKSSCAKCNPCPHGKLKGSCAKCNPCPHGKLKDHCTACTPCPHGKLKRDCAACKSARAGPPEIKLEPEIKQEPFTIRGYFGFGGTRESNTREYYVLERNKLRSFDNKSPKSSCFATLRCSPLRFN